MKLVVTTCKDEDLVQCNYCRKTISHFVKDEMVPSAEECYILGNVPVPNFGWFCSQDCASKYEKENNISFEHNTEGKIDYYNN